MSRRAGTRTTFAALAVTAALLIPASQAAAGAQIARGGDGPVATKSGAIVNFLPAGKLKVAKTLPAARDVLDQLRRDRDRGDQGLRTEASRHR